MTTLTATFTDPAFSVRNTEFDFSILFMTEPVVTQPSQWVLYSETYSVAITFGGTFTGYDGSGFPTGGEITSMRVGSPGHGEAIFEGFLLTVEQFFQYGQTNDGVGLMAHIYAGADTITGSLGGDSLSGWDGDDVIEAGEGSDFLDGGSGADVVRGQGGDDVIAIWGAGVDGARDTYDGGDGEDNLDVESSDTVFVNLQAGFVRVGTGVTDILVSIENVSTDEGDDRIVGSAGTNYVNAGAGADSVTAGDGADTVYGEEGDDIVDLGLGADYASGGEGDDRVRGRDGADVIDGNAGLDHLIGDEGSDTLRGGDDADTVLGGSGEDILYGGTENDLADGGQGDDIVQGEAGDDTLSGGDGRDRLYGGAGNDELWGGADADQFFFATGFGDDVIKDWEDGADRIRINMAGVDDIGDIGIVSDAGHAVVTFPDGSQIVIEFAAGQIDASDFIIGAP